MYQSKIVLRKKKSFLFSLIIWRNFDDVWGICWFMEKVILHQKTGCPVSFYKIAYPILPRKIVKQWFKANKIKTLWKYFQETSFWCISFIYFHVVEIKTINSSVTRIVYLNILKEEILRTCTYLPTFILSTYLEQILLHLFCTQLVYIQRRILITFILI